MKRKNVNPFHIDIFVDNFEKCYCLFSQFNDAMKYSEQ